MSATFEWSQTAPTEHTCYPHHFAGNPLVPGALLLEWIDRQLQARAGFRIAHIKQIKFLAPVRPGMNLRVAFTENTRGYALSVNHQDTPIAQGQVRLADLAVRAP